MLSVVMMSVGALHPQLHRHQSCGHIGSALMYRQRRRCHVFRSCAACISVWSQWQPRATAARQQLSRVRLRSNAPLVPRLCEKCMLTLLASCTVHVAPCSNVPRANYAPDQTIPAGLRCLPCLERLGIEVANSSQGNGATTRGGALDNMLKVTAVA